MPMHYPPLANGTYRYGDAPQPLPSPTPGPDPQPPGMSGYAARGDAIPDATAQGATPQGAMPQDQPASAALPYGPTPQGGHPSQQPPPHFPQPNSLPQHLLGHPGGGPAPEAPTEQTRSRNTVAAVAILGGLTLVVVALLGVYFFGPGSDRGGSVDTLRGPLSQGQLPPQQLPATDEFTAEGTFTVVASPGESVSGDRNGCDMPGSLSDIGEGTTLTLLEADTGRSATSMLTYDGGDLTSCTFTFEFPDVSPGGSIYMIELPGRGQLVYTEDELRTGIDISLGR